MANLYTKVKLYIEENSKTYDRSKVTIADYGTGAEIKSWTYDDLNKPTDAQLDALSSQAETLEKNAIAVANRQKEYGSIASQIEFITEKGLEAWKTNVQSIKTKYPKESE